jgi:hypothetical protein
MHSQQASRFRTHFYPGHASMFCALLAMCCLDLPISSHAQPAGPAPQPADVSAPD